MIMDNRLQSVRILPDGTSSIVSLFHISLEGLEKHLICRDEEDYDAMVKNIFLCSKRENVIVVIYAVVSNHAHIAVLASDLNSAKSYADALKKVQSMWVRRKYGDIAILNGRKVDVSPVTTMDYARNVLAYIPRNALDNCAKNIESYKWTGYRAFFRNGEISCHTTKVSQLSTRQCEAVMHTGTDLSDVPWLLNDCGEIEPASACDWKYLENIFLNDQSFFLRKIGSVNTSEIEYRQSVEKYRKLSDSEFLSLVENCSIQWFQTDVHSMNTSQKVKLIHYLSRKIFLSVPQVSRCLSIERTTVAKVLGRKSGRTANSNC